MTLSNGSIKRSLTCFLDVDVSKFPFGLTREQRSNKADAMIEAEATPEFRRRKFTEELKNICSRRRAAYRSVA